MAQSAITYLVDDSNMYDAHMDLHTVRMTLSEKSRIRQRFMACFTEAVGVLQITDNPCTNPTFDTVETLMAMQMGLEEQKDEVRDDICYFLQYEVDYVIDRRFHDEIKDVRDTTDDADADAIYGTWKFLANVTNVDGIFESSQVDCDSIINRIHRHLCGEDMDDPSTNGEQLTELQSRLLNRYDDMKTAWSRLIQCAINYENATVFHEISERVWTTGEAVDAAVLELEDMKQTLTESGEVEILGEESPEGQGETETQAQPVDDLKTTTNVAEGEYKEESNTTYRQELGDTEERENSEKEETTRATPYEPRKDTITSDETSANTREGKHTIVQNDEIATESNKYEIIWREVYERAARDKAKKSKKAMAILHPQVHTHTRTTEHISVLGQLNDSISRYWSCIEALWDKAVTRLSGKKTVQSLEVPLSAAWMMIKQTLRTSERMVEVLPKSGDRNDGQEVMNVETTYRGLKTGNEGANNTGVWVTLPQTPIWRDPDKDN